MGNTNKRYNLMLIKARPAVEKAYEGTVCFKSEVHRTQVSDDDRDSLFTTINGAHTALLEVLKTPNLNIPAAEREGIRGIKTQIAGLRGAVEDYKEGPETTPEATRLMVKRVEATVENLREFLQWMDQKVEKRWWFKVLIRYIKSLLLIGTFLSATMAVAFPEFGGPIVTLALTVSNGVLEMVAQMVEGKSLQKNGNLLQSSSQRIAPSV